MACLAGLAPVVETLCQIKEQAKPLLCQVQKPDTIIGRVISTGKIDPDPKLTTGWKRDLLKATIRHRWPPS